jgi:hypothetical protein
VNLPQPTEISAGFGTGGARRLRPYRSDWVAIVVLLCCLASGFAVSAQTGKGILLVAAPIIVAIPLIRMVTDATYNKGFLVALIGFVSLTLLNGSRLTSVALVVAGILLFESLQRRFQVNRWDRADTRAFLVVVALVCALSLLDVVTGLHFDTWVRYTEGVSRFSAVEVLPRLRLFFSEPSYLGTFAAAALYWGRHSRAVLILMGGLLLATHSLYGFVYLFVLLLRSYPRALLLGLSAGLAGSMIAMKILGADLFFLSSGLVRLVGASLFDSMSITQLLFGAGIGSGDERLSDLFVNYGVFDVANGFIWTFLYDAGIIGAIFYFCAYCRSIFEVVHLSVLLLNFGPGSFLVPVLQVLVRINQDQERSFGAVLARPGVSSTPESAG